MRTNQSSTPSEFSLTSSLDQLTLSPSLKSAPESSPRSPSIRHENPSSNASATTSDSEYEVIVLPSPEARRLSKPSLSSSGELIGPPSIKSHDATEDPGPSTAAIVKKSTKGRKGKKVDPDATPKKPKQAVHPTTKASGSTKDIRQGKKPIKVKLPPAVGRSSHIPVDHLSDSSDGPPVQSSPSEAELKQGKKTRRSGRRNRLRVERAQVREVLRIDADTTPPSSPGRIPVVLPPRTSVRDAVPTQSVEDGQPASIESLTRQFASTQVEDSERRGSALDDSASDQPADEGNDHSEDGASRMLDEADLDDDETEVDDLSVLGDRRASTGTGFSNRRLVVTQPPRSLLSSEDASTSIDSFLTGDPEFVGDKANKLRLWQALCVELGLVQSLDDLPDLPIPPPDPAIHQPPKFEIKTHPFPQTSRKARGILKENAHINLSDYFEARASGEKDFRHLLYPSASALAKYSFGEGKLVALPTVKAEWLEPLLKEFGIKRAKMK